MKQPNPTSQKNRCLLPFLPVLSGCVLSNLCLQRPSRRWCSQLCSLAPTHPPGLFISCTDYTSNSFSICSLFLVFCCALTGLCERDERCIPSKCCSSVMGGGSCLPTQQPPPAHPVIFGWCFIPFIKRVLADCLGKNIKTAEKVDAVCFSKHININSSLAINWLVW